MVEVASVEDLAAVWGSVLSEADPVAAITGAGHQLAPTLRGRLETRTSGTSALQRRADTISWLRETASAHGFAWDQARFAIKPRPPLVAAELPAGEFDVVASVRLEVIDQVLQGLFDSRAWPHELQLPPGVLSTLMGRLRDLSADVPDVEGLEVGALHLTAAPTASVGPGSALRLAQAVTLDVDLVQDAAPRRTNVASLSGVFYYDLTPIADEIPPVAPEVLPGLTIELDLATADVTEEFHIDPASDIQPRNPAALEAFTAFFVPLAVTFIRIALGNQAITITPNIRLPFDRDVPVRVFAARVATAPTGLGNGALHVGVMVGFTEDAVAPAVPDTVSLQSDPFGRSAVNVVVATHVSTIEAALRAARPRIEERLQERINAAVPLVDVDVVLESFSVHLRPPDVIGVTIAAHIPDFCGLGPLNFIDLDFDIDIGIEAPVVNGVIRPRGNPEIDVDNGDLLVCAITESFDGALLQVGDSAYTIGLLFVGIGGNVLDVGPFGEHRFNDLNGVFDPHTPIPLTELVPRAEVLQVAVTDSRVELRGSLDLFPATEQIFGYVRVLEEISNIIPGGGPVEGARVVVRDQDVPAPAGDDFVPPRLETPVILRGQTVTIRLDRRIEAPTRNETIGSATTNAEGLARLVLDRASAGGRGATLVTTRTAFFTTVEREPETSVIESPLSEALPDVYLAVILPDGRQFDSRRPGGIGLVVNLESNHIGTADQPLTFLVPRGLPENQNA